MNNDNYFALKNIPDNYNFNSLEFNPYKESMDNDTFEKVKEENNINSISKEDIKSNNLNDNENFNNNYNSINIIKNLSLLGEIEKEEETMNNKTISNKVHCRKTIPNNYKKKIRKLIKNKQLKAIHNKFKNNNSQNQKKNIINFDNLESYYLSPVLQKELNKNRLTYNTSSRNSVFDKYQKKNNNSYFARSTTIIPNTRPILNSNNFHYTSKSGIPITINSDSYDKNDILNNTYKYIPKKICSLVFEGRKNKTNLNINSNRNKNKFIKINDYKDRNNFNFKNNYKNKLVNSIGLYDNSVSTNFVDIPSLNENNNISTNDNNNQYSLIYNKNMSTSFQNKGKRYFGRIQNKIYIKKKNNNNLKAIISKNYRINKKSLEKHLNSDIYNSINTNSSNNKTIFEINEKDKEKRDDFIIISDLLNTKKNNSDNLKIISGAINENVNNEMKKQEMQSTLRGSEAITIQSLSDSKILEIANYYLNEEETVDRTEIGDILLTKNKSNYN